MENNKKIKVKNHNFVVELQAKKVGINFRSLFFCFLFEIFGVYSFDRNLNRKTEQKNVEVEKQFTQQERSGSARQIQNKKPYPFSVYFASCVWLLLKWGVLTEKRGDLDENCFPNPQNGPLVTVTLYSFRLNLLNSLCCLIFSFVFQYFVVPTHLFFFRCLSIFSLHLLSNKCHNLEQKRTNFWDKDCILILCIRGLFYRFLVFEIVVVF